MNLDEIRADHQRIMRRRETTVREWLEDVTRRRQAGCVNALEPREQEAFERVIGHLIGIADQAWQVIDHHADDDALTELHNRLMVLRSPIRLDDE